MIARYSNLNDASETLCRFATMLSVKLPSELHYGVGDLSYLIVSIGYVKPSENIADKFSV